MEHLIALFAYGTGIVTTWTGILYWVLKSKIKQDILDSYPTKKEMEEWSFSKSDTHKVFISERTHDMATKGAEERFNLRFSALENSFKDSQARIEKSIDSMSIKFSSKFDELKSDIKERVAPPKFPT